MDEALKIPYIFSPQRYRSGGNDAPNSGAAGFFKGLSDAFELYLQLQQAKEARAEREQDRRERQTDREATNRFREGQQTLAQQEQASRAAALQQDRENQELQYGQKAGITLNPGMVRRQMEAPTNPNTLGFSGAPTAEGVSEIVRGMRPRQEEGLSGLFQRGGEALKHSYQTGLPETFEGGVSTRPASEERYNFRASESANTLQAERERTARAALHDWYTSRASYAGQQLAQFRAQNPFVIPGDKAEDPIIDRAFQDYEKLHAQPQFTPEIERTLGRTPKPGVPLPNPNPAPPTGPKPAGTDTVSPQDSDAFQRQLQATMQRLKGGKP